VLRWLLRWALLLWLMFRFTPHLDGSSQLALIDSEYISLRLGHFIADNASRNRRWPPLEPFPDTIIFSATLRSHLYVMWSTASNSRPCCPFAHTNCVPCLLQNSSTPAYCRSRQVTMHHHHTK
jgi:hypothetical protein